MDHRGTGLHQRRHGIPKHRERLCGESILSGAWHHDTQSTDGRYERIDAVSGPDGWDPQGVGGTVPEALIRSARRHARLEDLFVGHANRIEKGIEVPDLP